MASPTKEQRSWLAWLAGREYVPIEERRRVAKSCMSSGWTEWVVRSRGEIVKWRGTANGEGPIGERLTESGRAALAAKEPQR